MGKGSQQGKGGKDLRQEKGEGLRGGGGKGLRGERGKDLNSVNGGKDLRGEGGQMRKQACNVGGLSRGR